MKKYLEIFVDLQRHIGSGTYPENSLLPSENSLALQYSTSRETIRKALKDLETAGYIQKVQGKGSIVLDRSHYPVPIGNLMSFKQVQSAEGLEAHTKVIENRVIDAPDFLVNQGWVKADEKMILLVRQRFIEGKPVILDKDYLRLSLVPQVDTQAAEESLYDYLEKVLHLHIAYANKEFIAQRVSEEDKELLDLGKDSHVLVVNSDVHLEDTTFLQFTESRHCLDRFRFIDFSRRQLVPK